MGIALAIGGLIAGAVSTGVGVYGAAKQAQAEDEANRYNAEMEKRNAELAEMEAKFSLTQAEYEKTQAGKALEIGKEESRKFTEQVKTYAGKQRASTAASGVLVDSGSTLQNVLDTYEYGSKDALTIKRNAAVEAQDYLRKAEGAFKDYEGYTRQGINYRESARFISGRSSNVGLKVGSTLLTGVSGLGMDLYKLNKAGWR